MSEGDVHKHLKQVGGLWLKKLVTDLVATEVEFWNASSVADVVGINLERREIRVIEVKASHADFIRDKKLWDTKTSYHSHVHYSYILCPPNVIQASEAPKGYGLLWCDDRDNIKTVKRPTKQKDKLKTTFETTLRRTTRALTNQVLYRDQNQLYKDFTRGTYSQQAHIWLVGIRCPQCCKTHEYLIHQHNTQEVTCPCRAVLTLREVNVRYITGFNKKFTDQLITLLR